MVVKLKLHHQLKHRSKLASMFGNMYSSYIVLAIAGFIFIG
jgi:hypothetical protein